MKQKVEVEVETVNAKHFYDVNGVPDPTKTKGVYHGRIMTVGNDFILLKLDDHFDTNNNNCYSFYPDLIRIDKIVSVRRVKRCEIIKAKRRG